MGPRARLAVVGIALAAVVVGFVLARSAGDEPAGGPATTRPATPAERPATAAAAAPRVETIGIVGGGPAGEPRELVYRRGDRVRLRFVSDGPAEVHVHGYDVVRRVEPSRPTRVDVTADAEGVFEIESHGTGEVVAHLEVRP